MHSSRHIAPRAQALGSGLARGMACSLVRTYVRDRPAQCAGPVPQRRCARRSRSPSKQPAIWVVTTCARSRCDAGRLGCNHDVPAPCSTPEIGRRVRCRRVRQARSVHRSGSSGRSRTRPRARASARARLMSDASIADDFWILLRCFRGHREFVCTHSAGIVLQSGGYAETSGWMQARGSKKPAWRPNSSAAVGHHPLAGAKADTGNGSPPQAPRDASRTDASQIA